MKKKLSKPKKIALTTVTALLLVPALFISISTFNTQLMIGLFQSAFGSVASSTFDPRDPNLHGEQPGGQYRISNIKYADEYPNSYFDIVYPNSDTKAQRPTMIYIHGGGFFFGSKQSGDPLAGADSNALFQKITDEGYNIVTMDYALVPQHHYPTPLIQLDQFLSYLTEHAEEYNITMDNLHFFGQSAGAIIISQYFTAAGNPEFARLAGIEPTFDTNTVDTLIIDDGPLNYQAMNLFTKFMVGNYLNGDIYPSDQQQKSYNPIPYVNENFPRSFVIGSDSYGQDMVDLTQRLTEHEVDNKLVWPKLEDGSSTNHTFISRVDTDPVAQRTFTQMIDYIK